MRRRIHLLDLIARGPVQSPGARRALLGRAGPTGVRYTGPPTCVAPVVPLQVFGVPYDLDLVLVDDHPDWDMHELARVRTPDGPVWLVKDSRAGTLEQRIVADVDGLDTWLPEIPLARHPGRVDVVDRSTDARIDLRIAYTNVDGDPVRVAYEGATPRPVPFRNSSTMGHSRDQVLAVLDLPRFAFAQRAAVRIAGRRRSLRRIAGLVPFAVALQQTQAGLSVGAWDVTGDAASVRTVHASGARQRWTSVSDEGGLTVRQDGPLRSLVQRLVPVDGGLELRRVEVWPHAASVPSCVLRIVPGLPDIRRPFEGTYRCRWVIDVDGQPSHATGDLVVRSNGREAFVWVVPGAPRWTRDRPLVSRVRLRPDGAHVQVRKDVA